MPARISFYRPTGQSRRSARSAQHDEILEGLPIRRWRREWVSVGRPSNAPTSNTPIDMPKEANLLTPTSQALLQAARSGSASKKDPAPSQAAMAPTKLFSAMRWVQIPREHEPPEPVYLANAPGARRKGGVEGDEGLLGVQQPVVVTKRRAPPPPKKKNKPRGRRPGFKKTVTFQQEEEAANAAAAAAAAGGAEGAAEASAASAAASASAQASAQAAQAGVEDTEMVDVDAATEENPAPINSVAQEMEKAEAETEKATLEQQAVDAHAHALPAPESAPLLGGAATEEEPAKEGETSTSAQ